MVILDVLIAMIKEEASSLRHMATGRKTQRKQDATII